MSDSTALCGYAPNRLTPPPIDLSALPAKLTKRLWVTPTEFLVTTHALRLAEWVLTIRERLRPSLPDPSRAGRSRCIGIAVYRFGCSSSRWSGN